MKDFIEINKLLNNNEIDISKINNITINNAIQTNDINILNKILNINGLDFNKIIGSPEISTAIQTNDINILNKILSIDNLDFKKIPKSLYKFENNKFTNTIMNDIIRKYISDPRNVNMFNILNQIPQAKTQIEDPKILLAQSPALIILNERDW
jgi:hypothetical protein